MAESGACSINYTAKAGLNPPRGESTRTGHGSTRGGYAEPYFILCLVILALYIHIDSYSKQ